MAVLDLALPDGDRTDLIAELRQRRPKTPVAILSVRKGVYEATSKADAAIHKGTPLPDMISSLRRLAVQAS